MRSCSHRKVFIRTDANPTIAGGHVMRCLSVADELANVGADVEFVLSDSTPAEIIEGRGFSDRVLGTDWRNIEEGVEPLCELCDAAVSPVVLVDTYSITKEYVEFLAAHAPVCYLGSKGGDLGNLALIANYSTDIDERFYRETYGGRNTKLLLGPGYAPLRHDFSLAYRERTEAIRNVLLTTGNTDPYGFIPMFLRGALECSELNDVLFSVVVGSMVSDEVYSEILGVVSGNSRVEIHRAVRDMASLMQSCDAAVTANGTTVYELSAAGLPSVTFAMVEEQVASAESLASLGAIRYCGLLAGDVREVAAECVRNLVELVSDSSEARRIAERAHGLIDGLGAAKIAKEIMTL
jgi:UDP-2,4-diacetamido-2,4,6-trideoxy-beta-L-altropyranose hydrolase